jgi:hypothetical protein
MKQGLTFIAILHLAALGSPSSLAEELQDGDGPQMSREQWQDRLKASRERAAVMRRERKGLYADQPPTPDELAEEATKRVLEDGSLLPGDIVSTKRGLFRFQGSPDRQRKPDDFVPVR